MITDLFQDSMIFQALLLNSLIIVGFNFATEPDMILGFIETYCKRYPLWIQKPLYLCIYCMSSLHSLWVFPFLELDILYWPLYVLALVGTVGIVYHVNRILREYNN